MRRAGQGMGAEIGRLLILELLLFGGFIFCQLIPGSVSLLLWPALSAL